ncbi:MAG: hypothetical protein KGQ41_00005 [Alphaproteobacteria bacterium]|nr:hypothetical protein [Alphaproteobacteria bacterium]
MTTSSQALPAGYTSRNKQRLAVAIEFVKNADISPELRRAILGNKKRSESRATLKLYFALNAKRFPVSEATAAIRAEQDKLRAALKKKQAEERQKLHKARVRASAKRKRQFVAA